MNDFQNELGKMNSPFHAMDVQVSYTETHASEHIEEVDRDERLWVWTDGEGNKALVNDVGNGWFHLVGDVSEEAISYYFDTVAQL